MLTTIPFSGFYESLHDGELDRALELAFSDDNGDARPEIVRHAYDAVDWREVHLSYAAKLAEYFADEFGLTSLKFESMRSPREYNFSTDVIYCTWDESEARATLAKVDPETMGKVCSDRFTSRSGFMSFYSPDWQSWGDVSTWDHNQIGAILAALVLQEKGEDWRDWDLMEPAICNGYIDNWIFASNPEKLNRLDRINRYLNQRMER